MLPPPPPYSKLPPRNQTSPNFTLPRNENSTERSPLLPARNPTPVPRRDNTTTFCSTVITPPADPVAVIVPNPEPSLNGLIYFFVVMLTVILSLVYLPPYSKSDITALSSITWSLMPSVVRDVHRSQAGVSWDSPLQGQCVRYGSSRLYIHYLLHVFLWYLFRWLYSQATQLCGGRLLEWSVCADTDIYTWSKNEVAYKMWACCKFLPCHRPFKVELIGMY